MPPRRNMTRKTVGGKRPTASKQPRSGPRNNATSIVGRPAKPTNPVNPLNAANPANANNPAGTNTGTNTTGNDGNTGDGGGDGGNNNPYAGRTARKAPVAAAPARRVRRSNLITEAGRVRAQGKLGGGIERYHQTAQGVPSFPRDSNATRRRKAGAVALREIRYYQESFGFLIPKRAFTKLVREIAGEVKRDLRFQASAICNLQEAAESFLVTLMEASHLATIHAGRVTLFNKDMRNAIQIAKILGPYANILAELK